MSAPDPRPARRSGRSLRILQGMTVLGGLGALASYFLATTPRFWANWIIWFAYLLTVGLGALFLVALEHLAGARWSVPLRRAPERVSSLVLLASAAGIVALFSLGSSLYPWTTPKEFQTPIVAGKAAWLNVPFFATRALACFGLWALSYRILVRGSIAQDSTRDPAVSARLRKFAPAFLAIFGLTITVVAFDWISSLEPEWYSDIFGVYVFAGSFLAGLAASTLVALHLKDRGRLPGIRSDHLYNLGGYLFAFTVFWSYIGFAQYMLIWYANLPEEVSWYKERIEGHWINVVLVLAAIHFLIPFFALITRDSKGDPGRLRRVALLVLAAHWLDLYWMVFPVLNPDRLIGLPEVFFGLFFVGASLLWLRRSLRQGADMPVGDPHLQEGLEFRL